MLELFHWEPNGACARVMICLSEKQLQFTSRYIDVLAFEQHLPEFLQLNESGEVPVLVHDGAVFSEASSINEYLDESFPGVPLMPRDAKSRWRVRAWQKYVDDHVAASVSELAWQAYGVPAMRARDPATLTAAIARIPARERREAWTVALAGLSDERLARARARIMETIEKTEEHLEGGAWLAGSSYSLADIAAFPFLSYVPALIPQQMNDSAAPHTMAWLRTVASRPTVKAAFALARTPDPYATAAPGPEQVRWG
jgi:GST-like protein